jgi:hypothetical protein
VELPGPPAHWGWGTKASLLVGALAHSGRWRGWLSASMDQPHLVEGLDRVTRALGGLTGAWRFDRMATVVHPESGRVTASFAAVAKHYGVSVRPCPPRRGNRKGVVEKANHVAAQRFWRTLPDDVTPEQAQQLLDTWCTRRGDIRLRSTTDGKATVATIAAREPLRPAPPLPFPATLSVSRTVSAQALVSFRGNRYSVAPELASTSPVTGEGTGGSSRCLRAIVAKASPPVSSKRLATSRTVSPVTPAFAAITSFRSTSPAESSSASSTRARRIIDAG